MGKIEGLYLNGLRMKTSAMKKEATSTDRLTSHIVCIKDDFDLRKIIESGQCFRAKELKENFFRFIHGKEIIYLRQLSEEEVERHLEKGLSDRAKKERAFFEVSCTPEEWKSIWISYFDLENRYASFRRRIPKEDRFLKLAAKEASGIRILRQEPFELLLTFIISQRKSIPAIQGALELIATKYGKVVKTPYERLHLFPSPEELSKVTLEDLKDCKLGYRAPYVLDAIERVYRGDLVVEELYHLPDEELLEALKGVHGVGTKVASCIALFAYGRTAMAPVDTWIQQVIDNKYEGINPFPAYGEIAGILQQYIFYYAIHHKRDF